MLKSLYARLAAFRARKDESGQGMVEYALILVLIAIVVITISGRSWPPGQQRFQ